MQFSAIKYQLSRNFFRPRHLNIINIYIPLLTLTAHANADMAIIYVNIMETIAGNEAEDPLNNTQLLYIADNSQYIDEAYFIQYLPTSVFPASSEGIYIYTHVEDCQMQSKNPIIYATIFAVGIIFLLLHVVRSTIGG